MSQGESLPMRCYRYVTDRRLPFIAFSLSLSIHFRQCNVFLAYILRVGRWSVHWTAAHRMSSRCDRRRRDDNCGWSTPRAGGSARQVATFTNIALANDLIWVNHPQFEERNLVFLADSLEWGISSTQNPSCALTHQVGQFLPHTLLFSPCTRPLYCLLSDAMPCHYIDVIHDITSTSIHHYLT